METTICVLRLVFTGLYERHPDFKLVAPHLGAAMPYLLGRIDYETSRYPNAGTTLSIPPSEHLRRVYLDSVSVWPPAVRLVLDVFGAHRLLFGTDAPFWDRQKSVDTIHAVGLDEGDLERVLATNAETLFRCAP
jgi:aminocarboxymuconate-semialdehyde decarboxylase